MITKVDLDQNEFKKMLRKSYNNGVLRDVEEFIAADYPICEVSTKGYKNSKAAYSSYRNAVNIAKAKVRVITSRSRVFMVKEDELE